MNHYERIKEELVNNEIYKRVKDYSKNKRDLKTYYNVGKMLAEDGKHYGEGIIKKYSLRLTKELGKGYSERNLRNMRQLNLLFDNQKWQTLSAKLTYSHYCEIMWLNCDAINYYVDISIQNNLSVRELRNRIKSKEYERLDDKTKTKLKNNNELMVGDLVKNPIVLTNNLNKEIIKEKALKELILDDMDNFLEQLGNGFSYIKSEYKIKIGNNYNYIDLLLFNYIYNSFVVIELKVTELKKEHIGQIEVYMNYIDQNIKDINQNKTIGIIMTKEGNEYIMKYCSDPNIFNTIYKLV